MPDPNCPECGGTGLIDSGGFMPWGEPAYYTCTQCLTPEEKEMYRKYGNEHETVTEDNDESSNQTS